MSSASHPGRKAAARLGRVGVWSSELRYSPPEDGQAGAQELDQQGWPVAWMPGGIDDRILADIDRLLSATPRIVLASGILNLWKHAPEDVGAWWDAQSAERQARVMLGIGVSHAPLVGDAYKRPLETMRDYLQRLRELGIPAEHLCVAALGPKMLELSAELTAGAHPYLVTPEHTAIARQVMGPEALLAPEQGVILETDPARARALGRQALANYLQMPNYLNSWRRLGFSDEDLAGSDRLIDGLFAWGDVGAIRDRLKAHFDAGADHVCIQVVTGPMAANFDLTRTIWRELAPALL